MASFPRLPSIHMLPGATCSPHLFSDDGSPDQACAPGLAAVIVAQAVLRLSHSRGPASALGTATVGGPASSELSFNWLQIGENLKGSMQSTTTSEQGYNRAALQTRACVLSHQAHSGVAAAPAPAELFGANYALAARPGTDHAALRHYSPLNRDRGMDDGGQAGQGDSDSPSAGSEEPDRRRPRGRGMAGDSQVGWGAGICWGHHWTVQALHTQVWQYKCLGWDQGMCSKVQAGWPQLSELLALFGSRLPRL